MENFEYYEITEDGVVFVRERATDFFALYSPRTKKWHQPDNISFMELTHDHDYIKISKEEAFQKTNRSALEALFQEYESIIKENSAI